MSEQYFVKYKKRLQGPFSVDQLKTLLKRGKLTRAHLVSEDRRTWVALGDLNGIRKEPPSSQTQAVEEPQKSISDSNVTENINEDTDLIEEEVVEQGPLTSGSLLLRLLGGLCIAIGAVDFITANTGMYDVYAGVPFVYQIGIGNFSLGFFTVIILCGIGGYLCRAGKNAAGNVAQDQKIMGWIGGSWLFILAFTNAGPLTGLGGEPMFDSEAYMVKNGSLYDCPNRTLGDMANSFMAYPQWETILADDGNTYVNLTGEIMVDNRETTALIQFKVTADEFALEAVEYNGAPQTIYEANNLLDIMCSTY